MFHLFDRQSCRDDRFDLLHEIGKAHSQGLRRGFCRRGRIAIVSLSEYLLQFATLPHSFQSETLITMKIPLPILFALGTALCWGLYGPVVGNARSPEKLWSPFKPYVGIGVAYIVWAFIGGLIVMKLKGDSFDFFGEQSDAGVWGFFAGTLGALGALSLTSAMLSFDGPPKPQVVMPVVFGGAVTVTAIVSMIQYRSEFNPWLWIGIVGMGICIVLVAYNTPHGSHKPAATGDAHSQSPSSPESSGDAKSSSGE